MESPHPIVAFSHLRWDFVYQRPQHLLSRLARHRRVFVIEEPWATEDGTTYWERSTPAPGLTVLRPRTPSRAPGFHAEQLPHLARLLGELVAAEGLGAPHMAPIAWLYTPLALPLAERLAPAALVYDCMDELSLFHGAPPELLQRERELLAAADVVFTGGPSLYAAKRDRHPNVHCFPSSVDAEHFRRARLGAVTVIEPADQAHLPRPRLGFYGVIDERFDVPLLEAMAYAHPEWQIVLVGPVVKIDPAILPRLPNVHYTGQRGYEALPGYLAGWDVCLLPFARNDATRFISPTKTLEYMAAERPIVSTPITDVAAPYGDFVYLGDTPEAFIAACERALAADAAERRARTERMRAVLARTSWDATAAAMGRELSRVLAGAGAEATARGADLAATA
ncbi:MAG TPA: glycosyltransferase [Gemmatimonadales bacterium]|nr:glycosyltransferase [Gemmatimonadales bacterium]